MKIHTAVVVITSAFFQIARAEDNMLLGDWRGDDHASESIYGTIHIAEKQISWGGTNPYNSYCETTYTIVGKESAVTYPGAPAFRIVPGREFTIYKLKLAPQPCRSERYLQFAIQNCKKSTDLCADVVTYTRDGRQAGWHLFSKVSERPGAIQK